MLLRHREARGVVVAVGAERDVVVGLEARAQKVLEVVGAAGHPGRALAHPVHHGAVVLRNELAVEVGAPHVVVAVYPAGGAAFAVHEGVKGVLARAVRILQARKRQKPFLNRVAAVQLNREALLVLVALLGGDENGAVLGAVAVEGGRGRALQHGVGLNVIRADVPRIGVDGKAIHHVQRHRVAANGHVGCPQQLSRGAHGQARHLAREAGNGVGVAGPNQVFAIHFLHGVANFAGFFRHAQSGNHHFVELLHVGLQGYGERLLAAHGHFLTNGTHEVKYQHVSWASGEGKLAVGVSRCASGRAFYQHAHAR